MAMNFKVFENKEQVAEYAADVIRKQFNNDPTTIADYDNNESYFHALGVPESQVYSLSYEQNPEDLISDKIKTKENKGKLVLQVLSIDENGHLDLNIKQGLMGAREIFLVVTGSNKRELIEKLYNENGKSNYEPSDLKAHRMVNVILDEAAAAGLPEDVKTYFTTRFA